jgi:hypothetical protein
MREVAHDRLQLRPLLDEGREPTEMVQGKLSRCGRHSDQRWKWSQCKREVLDDLALALEIRVADRIQTATQELQTRIVVVSRSDSRFSAGGACPVASTLPS